MDFSRNEQANGCRWSWNILPGSKLDLERLIIPVGCLYTPMKSLQTPHQSLEYDPVCCRTCKSVLNPYWYFIIFPLFFFLMILFLFCNTDIFFFLSFFSCIHETVELILKERHGVVPFVIRRMSFHRVTMERMKIIFLLSCIPSLPPLIILSRIGRTLHLLPFFLLLIPALIMMNLRRLETQSFVLLTLFLKGLLWV